MVNTQEKKYRPIFSFTPNKRQNNNEREQQKGTSSFETSDRQIRWRALTGFKEKNSKENGPLEYIPIIETIPRKLREKEFQKKPWFSNWMHGNGINDAFGKRVFLRLETTGEAFRRAYASQNHVKRGPKNPASLKLRWNHYGVSSSSNMERARVLGFCSRGTLHHPNHRIPCSIPRSNRFLVRQKKRSPDSSRNKSERKIPFFQLVPLSPSPRFLGHYWHQPNPHWEPSIFRCKLLFIPPSHVSKRNELYEMLLTFGSKIMWVLTHPFPYR